MSFVPFPDFCRPSYDLLLAGAVSCEETINWLLLPVPGGTKNNAALIPTPGERTFATIAGASSVDMCHAHPDGRGFAIAKGHLYEVNADGTATDRGAVTVSGMCSIACSQSQLLITSEAALGYVFTLTSNTLVQVTDPDWPGLTQVVEIDGYFIGMEPLTQKFFISGLNDGTTWDALDYGSDNGTAGNVKAIAADHRRLWLFDGAHSQAFYDSGNADFPWTRDEAAYMHQGVAAKATLRNIDNTLMWLGSNDDGAGVVWRASGYTPQRVSDYALEAAMLTYARIDDATAYPMQFAGHTLYVLHFPTAGATWVYSIATNAWTKWLYWNASTGQYEAHRGRTHMYAFGKHLVGDYKSGNIYELRQDVGNDAGDFIRRLIRRRAPGNGLDFIPHKALRLDMTVGVGKTDGSDVMMTLRLSDDGGKTWGAELGRSAGKIGEYKQFPEWWGLGAARDRVYEWVTTYDAPLAIANAYLAD